MKELIRISQLIGPVSAPVAAAMAMVAESRQSLVQVPWV